jgi:hypothetical protein
LCKNSDLRVFANNFKKGTTMTTVITQPQMPDTATLGLRLGLIGATSRAVTGVPVSPTWPTILGGGHTAGQFAGIPGTENGAILGGGTTGQDTEQHFAASCGSKSDRRNENEDKNYQKNDITRPIVLTRRWRGTAPPR